MATPITALAGRLRARQAGPRRCRRGRGRAAPGRRGRSVRVGDARDRRAAALRPDPVAPSSWCTGSCWRRPSSRSSCPGRSAHGGRCVEVMKQLRQRAIRDLVEQRADPDPAGAGGGAPRARLPHDPGDDQPGRGRARAGQGRGGVAPRPMRSRPACARRRPAARTASGPCCTTCRSRSARPGRCSCCGPSPARRIRWPPRSTAPAGRRSPARSRATTRCSWRSRTAARCSGSSGAWGACRVAAEPAGDIRPVPDAAPDGLGAALTQRAGGLRIPPARTSAVPVARLGFFCSTPTERSRLRRPHLGSQPE